MHINEPAAKAFALLSGALFFTRKDSLAIKNAGLLITFEETAIGHELRPPVAVRVSAGDAWLASRQALGLLYTACCGSSSPWYSGMPGSRVMMRGLRRPSEP